MAELALEVTARALTLTSPLYRLELALPADVRPQAAPSAKFDKAAARLCVTLPLAQPGERA